MSTRRPGIEPQPDPAPDLSIKDRLIVGVLGYGGFVLQVAIMAAALLTVSEHAPNSRADRLMAVGIEAVSLLALPAVAAATRRLSHDLDKHDSNRQ